MLIMNKKPAWMVALAGLVALTAAGCDDQPTDEDLIAALRLHRTSLEVVAEQLATGGPDAKIDLRGEQPVFQPPVTEVIADELATVLRDAEVNLVVSDSRYGGILFRTYGRGVAIDGVASGFVYRTAERFGEAITIVEDLDDALLKARSKDATGEVAQLRLAHPVDGRWGVFLASE